MSAPASTQETSSKEINLDSATRKTELKQMTETASNNKHSKKILYNTLAVYIKIIFNSIITLIATRIVLDCLGVNDFGLYNLLAGVIVLLSFMNGSLSFSTQRYLSIAIGEGRQDKLKSIFNSSMVIHAILALCVIMLLLLFQPILINKGLNIPQESIYTAHVVYDIMIATSVCTLLQVPYSAVMTAHEDIYYWAITEALNCFLRFISAVVLIFISSNKLEWYTGLVLVSLVISALAKYIWCRRKYEETKLVLSEMKNKALIKEMLGFVGWNTLGSSAFLIRNQGVAVLLNMFFGTIVNAAYGIANQVNGLVMTLASTITTVFAPSITQAHGAGEDMRMMNIAILSSKLSFFISSVTAIPLLVFMPEILELWLKDVPENSVSFCRLMICTFILMQLTAGLNRVVYAIGKVKWFQIFYTIILTLILPIGYLLFKIGMSVHSIFYVMLLAQVGIMLLEILYVYKFIKFELKKFMLYSISLSMILFCAILACSKILIGELSIDSGISEIIFGVVICIMYMLAYISLILSKTENTKLKELLKRRKI